MLPHNNIKWTKILETLLFFKSLEYLYCFCSESNFTYSSIKCLRDTVLFTFLTRVVGEIVKTCLKNGLMLKKNMFYLLKFQTCMTWKLLGSSDTAIAISRCVRIYIYIVVKIIKQALFMFKTAFWKKYVAARRIACYIMLLGLRSEFGVLFKEYLVKFIVFRTTPPCFSLYTITYTYFSVARRVALKNYLFSNQNPSSLNFWLFSPRRNGVNTSTSRNQFSSIQFSRGQ